MKIALFGCGNMASGLILPLCYHYQDLEVFTYTPSLVKARLLAQKIGSQAHFCKTITEIPSCDVYLLACKPQNITNLASDLKQYLPKGALVISILAATPIGVLEKLLQFEGMMRVMPNMAVRAQEGLMLSFNSSTSVHVSEILEKFHRLGTVIEVEQEEQLDQLTALVGCAPAFLIEVASVLKKMGGDYQLVLALFKSALALMKENNNFEDLVTQIACQGGMTAKGIETLREQKLEETFRQAFRQTNLQAKKIRDSF